MGNTRGLTDKPIEREIITEDGKTVAGHLTDVVTDPDAPEAVQIPDPNEFPTANATEQDPLAVDSRISPARGLDPDGADVNEVQTVTLAVATGGTFTLSFEGEETDDLAYNATSAQVTSALVALSTIGRDGEGHDNVAVSGPNGGPYAITFQNDLGAEDVELLTADASGLTTPTPAIAVETTQEGGGGDDEVQVITITNANGGTFTLDYDGQVTADIAYNATNTVVDTAIENLSNVAPGDVVVTGSAGGPWTVTFGGALANTDVEEIVPDGSDLTNTASVAVVEQTKGVRAD